MSWLSTQCFCEPKTALKYKIYFLLKITTLDKQNVIALGLLKWFQIPTEDLKKIHEDFPGGPVVKNPPANARDTGSIPGPGRSSMPQSS